MKRLVIAMVLWCAPMYAQQQVPVISGAVDIPVTAGNSSFSVILNQNVTSFKISGAPAAQVPSIVVQLIQDSTGSRTVAGYASNITNTSNIALQSAADSITPVTFAYNSQSNKWAVLGNPGGGGCQFTSSGAVNCTATGTNQNVTLKPSGTANVVVAANGLKFPDDTVQTTAGTQTPINYYVDSKNGNDSNSGTSPLAAWKTAAKIMSSFPAGAGDTLYLARGSQWNSSHGDGGYTLGNFSLKDGLTIKAYGGGPPPIVDSAAVASNASFSLVGGDTYTYQISWANNMVLAATGGTFMVWEDSGTGFRQLTLESTTANVEANACSFNAPALTSTPIDPATIYVHACDSSDVITNGYTYEISMDNSGLYVGNYADVEGIHFRFPSGGERSLDSKSFQYWKNDIFQWGQVHNAIIEGSGTVDHCLFWTTDNTNAGGGTSQLVFYEPTGGGAAANDRLIVENSTFIGGDPWNPNLIATDGSSPIYFHSADSTPWKSATFINNNFYNFYAGVGGLASNWTYLRNTFKRVGETPIAISGGTGTANAIIDYNYVDESQVNGATGGQTGISNGGSAGGIFNIVGNTVIMPGGVQYGAIYLQSPTKALIQNNTLISTSLTGGNVTGIQIGGTGTINLYRNVLSGFTIPIWLTSTATLNADYNLYWLNTGFGFGVSFNLNASSYSSFSAYQSGTGQDAHGYFEDPLFRIDPITGLYTVPQGNDVWQKNIGSGSTDASFENSALLQFMGANAPIVTSYDPGVRGGSAAQFSRSASLSDVTAQGSQLAGTVTLSAGTYTLTFTNPKGATPACGKPQDITTPANTASVTPSTSSLVFTGTGTDVLSYVCVLTN